MRSSRIRIVVVLPAPFGPRKPEDLTLLDFQIYLHDPALRAVDLVSFSVLMMATIEAPC